MSGSAAEATNEFSRIVTPDRLGGPAVVESIEATAAEREAVARRLGVLGIDRLTAEATVKSVGDRLFRVRGRWKAELRQACVVTLEPVPQSLEGDLEAAFQPGGGAGAASDGDVLIDPEAADPAEFLPEEGIDLGELAVQELSVALDPYPRAPGSEIPAEYRPPAVEEKEGPFAALKVLKGDE
ncbi:YceD family protein [Pelagibius sp. CAU 1746]|uniref:YceD family protein n=1 Tax=Pelagibius sp. CAU 1746 TaxID=3140370 RepID=UPI00325B06B0